MKDTAISDKASITNKNRYIFVQYYDTFLEDFEGNSYSFKSDLDLEIGDYVEVERSSQKVIGVITDIDYYNEDNSPYPYDELKTIIRKVNPVEIRTEKEWKEIEIKESRNLILNTMIGKLQLKRLIEILKDENNFKVHNDLYYYQKLNTFFFKDKESSLCFHAEYESEVITQEMYSIIIEDSIKIKIPKENTKDNVLYFKARKFCIDNNIDYYDDTDILEYTDEKRLFSNDNSDTHEESRYYKNIDEIIKDLENYEPSKCINHNPSYFIKEDKIIHFPNHISYQNRKIFKIPKFLRKNNYIDDKYYNRKNYPEFFEEQINAYNYEMLDRKRLSYMILRTFNIERISEGTIDYLCTNGYMLRAVKRLKELGPINDNDIIDENYEIYDKNAIIELKEQILNNIKYEDIIMMSFAEAGAMGEPGRIQFLLSNLKVYHTNYCYEGIDTEKIITIFPPLANMQCFCETCENLDDNWNWINIGCGNYLIIRKDLYSDFVKLVKEELKVEIKEGTRIADLFIRWIELAKKLMSEKENK